MNSEDKLTAICVVAFIAFLSIMVLTFEPDDSKEEHKEDNNKTVETQSQSPNGNSFQKPGKTKNTKSY